MRTGNRIACLVAFGMAIVSASLAQPRGKPGKPKAPTADAGAAASTKPDEVASDIPVARPEVMDGGLKPSPLNPQPSELPGGAVDGGTPLDYDRLLADIAALRARVAAVSDNLFHSRIGILVQTDGDHGKIQRLTVSVDDGVVYSAPPSFRADDMTAVYDHAIAPGRHAITFDVERKDDRDEAFRTAQRSRFVVDVPKEQRLEVSVRIGDDSTMGGDFPADRSGKYDLRLRVKAVARAVGK